MGVGGVNIKIGGILDKNYCQLQGSAQDFLSGGNRCARCSVLLRNKIILIYSHQNACSVHYILMIEVLVRER